jgi:excisionase family DNA binding protein
MTSTQQLVNIRDTASALAVSRGLVRKLIRQGVLPSVKIARCRRVPRRAIERILREGLPTRGDGVVR